jgi:hypothetical protein
VSLIVCFSDMAGCASTCQWIDGNDVFSIKLSAESERLHLRYKVRVKAGGWENVAQDISIIRLPCRFGGSRAFFICPGSRNGSACGRRAAKLHLSQLYFVCRQCNQLPYASQYEQPWQRAVRRAYKLNRRLGIDVRIAEPFPEKPKGMWVRTYGCLLDEILHAEMLVNQAKLNMFKRVSARSKNNLK